jgi:hypothetical protein
MMRVVIVVVRTMFLPEKKIAESARDGRVPHYHTFDLDTGKKGRWKSRVWTRAKAGNEVATRWSNLIPWRIGATWPSFAP